MTPKNVQMPNPNPKYKPPGTPAGGRGGNLMEIEKLIEKLRDAGWTNPGLTDKQILEWDAATALEQLQAENDRLKRERDAAVESWRGFCSQCAWKNHQYLADGKMDDRCRTCRDNAKRNWKWRGPKED